MVSLLRFFIQFLESKQHNPDARRKAYITNILVVTSIIFSCFGFFSSWIEKVNNVNHYYGIPLDIQFLFILLFTSIYMISYKGYSKFASLLLICVFFIPTAIGIYIWTIYAVVPILALGLIVMLSGLLINKRFSFILTIISVFYIILLTHYQEITNQIDNLAWMSRLRIDIWDSIIIALIFIFMYIITWISNNDIQKSLKRAHESERQLREERDLLETHVQERTEKIRKLESEKIVQLTKFAQIGKLSSGLFHDLVTPLTLISYNLEELESKPANKEVKEIEQLINNALTGTKRLETFITKVKNQIANNSEITLVSLDQELLSTVQLFHHQLQEYGIKVIYNRNEQIKHMCAVTRYNQLITNLVSNAVDATAATRKKNKHIKISQYVKGNTIVLSISDNGIGIKKHCIKDIFDPFYTTKKSNGTGLGLYIVYDIVTQDLKGTIQVKSIYRKGTTFTITFPHKV